MSCFAGTNENTGIIESNQVKPNTETLDLLKDYDREIWGGPDGWSDVQWQWKRQLRWGKECDYVADIEVHSISKSHQVIQVMCVPGSYQAMYYLFLYNKNNETSKQLALGMPESTDIANEIWGNVEFNKDNSLLTITSFSRGTRDCGIYRIFNFASLNFQPVLIEKRQRECGELSENSPEELFNPKKWPLVKH